MEPEVSICIPTYNRKEYLRETLDSVFAQTYADGEVVIVDDGSTDGTDQMIKDLGRDIRYVWQENRGDAVARNRLIELARGRFITFIDSDDLLMPDALEVMMKVMHEEGGQVVVYGPYFRIDENGDIYGQCERALYSGQVTKHLFRDIIVHSCGSVFPRSALQDLGGFDTSLRRCAVYKLLLQLSLHYRFVAVDKPVFKRRRHRGSGSDLSLDGRETELAVLEDFYYHGGGQAAVPRRWAMRRLGAEGYRAGRAAIRAGKYEQAQLLLQESFRRHPNLKAMMRWAQTWIAQRRKA